jgi:hypothetical protein
MCLGDYGVTTMKSYEIRAETRDSWEHELNTIRGALRGVPVDSDSTSFLKNAHRKLVDRMITDVLKEVCIRLGEGLCRYRKGWSDKKVTEFVNRETRRLLATKTPDAYIRSAKLH